jgi:hypothetical protein
MPYYIYKVTSPEGMDLVKNLELLEQFDSFKDAKSCVRGLRDKMDGKEAESTIKVMFAENQLLAEELLMEHREKPVTMEHEK